MHQKGQRMLATMGQSIQALDLPPPHAEVLPGVSWGAFDLLLTPAFWAGRAWMAGASKEYESYQLGSTLREEVAACLLGGYGIPAEVGIAAFSRVRSSGILELTPTPEALEALLAQPLAVNGRQIRYRFSRQKARYLAESLKRLPHMEALPSDDRMLRDLLAELPGIGLKTASWITRNWRDSDAVAILDIHVCRACVKAGVFAPNSNPAKSYRAMEGRFLAFARAIGVRASILDNLMWQTMRRIGKWR